MKKGIILLFLSTAILLSGCSYFKKTTNSTATSSSKTTAVSSKTQVESKNSDYKAKLDQAKQDYKIKRDQAYGDTLRKNTDALDLKDQDRVKWYNNISNDISVELTKRNDEELKKIQTVYDLQKQEIAKKNLDSDQLKKEQQEADSNFATNEFNQKAGYENKKVAYDRIKRTYEADVQALKDKRDTAIANFKTENSEKYDTDFDKITSASEGSGSEGDSLFIKEQAEFSKLCSDEDKKYDDGILQMNNWLEESLKGLL